MVRGGRLEEWERGKHREGSGHAGGSDKGESRGGFALGVWRKYQGCRVWNRNRERTMNNVGSVVTVFVDNLPLNVSKRGLYMKFGKFGYVNDIFVSRKARKTTVGPKLFISLSKYRKYDSRSGVMNGRKETIGQQRKITQKWVEIKKDRRPTNKGVKPINFLRVMNLLLDERKGPGDIECRDTGPYRYLVTFLSPEIRDEALNNELLNSVFDEVRHHWNLFWCLSRRVIKVDDRADESKSYTIARVLLDCFEWEKINEWIFVKIGDREFDVFVKEFGSEIYGVQSHPNVWDDDSDSSSREGARSETMVEKTSGVMERALNDVNLNSNDIMDPLLEAVIMEKWGDVHRINYDGCHYGRYSPFEMTKDVLTHGNDNMFGERTCLMDLDPMTFEAHIAKRSNGDPGSECDLSIQITIQKENKTVCKVFTNNQIQTNIPLPRQRDTPARVQMLSSL
ncbi:hypothetical protein PIB30_035507 [Stylosanthes scabra]|uniref:RRM domain-containing protein n=1 Tax=Stylosanthes scabra TaxID=79078 RepID=A0ABU6YBW5_9FABA|nr:hypothetical protein [Stylosanthes scabra]